MREIQEAARRQGSFIGTLRAIGWAFFGVRGGKGYERDLSRLNPLHVIIIGLLLAGAFIATLLVIINLVVG
jgi:hypothetical protein